MNDTPATPLPAHEARVQARLAQVQLGLGAVGLLLLGYLCFVAAASQAQVAANTTLAAAVDGKVAALGRRITVYEKRLVALEETEKARAKARAKAVAAKGGR